MFVTLTADECERSADPTEGDSCAHVVVMRKRKRGAGGRQNYP